MRTTSVLLAAMASFVLIAPAVACDTPTAEPGKSPLQTRKPVIGEDVRLTSGFGMQRHPLLDVPRLHTGVDWAAPTGTQVVAAGPGRVVEAGPGASTATLFSLTMAAAGRRFTGSSCASR
jgi:murein DD-endopeptidase MepM/ murein hydrolase activator NlpD